jgi:PKD repeat protein
MCAVMVLVAAVPLALADTHLVTKGPQGPRASAVTWSYAPDGYGVWTGHIVNSGLRSLVVDVDDVSTGMAVSILHQRIRFAAFDAFPAGEVTTEAAIMAAGRTYSITVTPNGPRGTTCTVEDMFKPAIPPTAVIKTTMDWMTVSADGSESFDPDGTIVAYAWDFGDGATASTMTATHTYATPGDKTVTLTVTDNDGLTGIASTTVTAQMPPPPTAAFTYSVTGATLSVDASTSSSIVGIASYSWNWGDGSAAESFTTPLATHTYVPPAGLSSMVVKASMGTNSVIVNDAPPPPPYTVFGYVVDSIGNPVFLADVTITDVNTGQVWTTTSDDLYGFYMVDLNQPLPVTWAAGDTIRVDVVKGPLSGTATGIAMGPGTEAYLQLDVTVTGVLPPTLFTVTLTVTDTFGQTAMIHMDVPIQF